MLKMMCKKNKAGFTLVELMAVVLIIGILVAIAIPVYNGASANAKVKACQANVRTINGAIQQWLAANTNKTEVDITTANWVATLVPLYVKIEPKCAVAANSYVVAAGTISCSDANHAIP